MRRFVACVVVTVLSALGMVVPSADAVTPHRDHAMRVNYLERPCRSEDQVTSCYWDASTAGNHAGTSFVVTMRGWVVWADGTRERVLPRRTAYSRNVRARKAHRLTTIHTTVRITVSKGHQS